MKSSTRSSQKVSKYKSLSLFSGIGGLDIGLHKVGFSPIFCCELDPNARKTLENHVKKLGISPRFESDINLVDPEALRRELKVARGEIDLLFGGPPCQAFSLIGKRMCLGDDRGILLYKMAEFAEAFRPKVILIEQVKGLLSAECERNVKGGALNKLISWLERLGYSVRHKILLAANYGVPQLRERLFIVASQNGTFEFPKPTHYKEGASDLFGSAQPYLTVREAISDLPNPDFVGEKEVFPNHADVTPIRDRERINGVPEGECLAKQRHLPKSQRMNLTDKDTTKFRRMSWDKPALTLRGGEAFYHPTANRYLTPREYLRLHGFEDDLVLFGPIKGRSGSFTALDQHRLVANSVPPKLAEVIGREIVSQLLEAPVTKSKSSEEIKALSRRRRYAVA